MNWNNLSLKQKADIIKMSVLSGITDLSEIQLLYNDSLISTRPTKKALGGQVLRKNKFEDGGITTAAKIEYLTNSYRKKDLLEPYDGNNDMRILPILSPQIAMFYSEKELDNLYNLYKNNPDIVYSHFQDNPLVGYAPLRLKTYYPITSEYPWTGHSELYLNDGSNQITTFGDTKGYNLVTNNCADSTRMALEAVFGKKLDYNLFTTPGDVRDFAIEQGGYYNKGKLDRGTTEVIIPMNETRYKNWKNYLRNPYTWWHDDNTPLPELEVYKYGGKVNKFREGGTIEPVDYETPWGITTRSRYRGEHTAPTSAIYFKSKEDRDAYAALLDMDLYGGVLPELEVVAKGVPIEEKPTTQRSPYADRFFNMSDWDSLFGPPRVNMNKNAWLRNPLYMQNWTDAGNAAAAFTVAPFATAALGEYAIPWLANTGLPAASNGARWVWNGSKWVILNLKPSSLTDGLSYYLPQYTSALNTAGLWGDAAMYSYFGADALDRLSSEDGVNKTINLYSNGDIYGGTKSLAGDILDASMIIPFTLGFYNYGRGLIDPMARKTAFIRNIYPFNYRLGKHKEDIARFFKDWLLYPIELYEAIPKYSFDNQAIFKAGIDSRQEAARISLGFPLYRNSSYIRNPDGTYSYNYKTILDNIPVGNRRPNKLDIEDRALFYYDALLKDGRSMVVKDFITGAGGNVKLTRTLDGLVMEDLWDLQPFQSLPKWVPRSIRDFEVIRFLGGDPLMLKHEMRTPFIIDYTGPLDYLYTGAIPEFTPPKFNTIE